MIDVENVDGMLGIIDAVADAILPAARTPLVCKWWSERGADATRAVRERTEEELHARSGNPFG